MEKVKNHRILFNEINIKDSIHPIETNNNFINN
jgi:hypothetical protein